MDDLSKLTVDTPSEAWNVSEKVRSVHRWLVEISSTLRTITEAHLPREPAERHDDWQHRANMSSLWPDFPLALKRYVGHLASNEFTWEVPESSEAFYDNVDRRGNDFKVFAQQVIYDLWQQGRPFVLVDSATRGGTDPRWLFFESHRVIRDIWGVSTDGSIVPKRIHLRDDKVEGVWGTKCSPRRWVLLGDGEPSQYPDGAPGPGAKLGTRGARLEFWREDPKEKGKWIPSTTPGEEPAFFAGEPLEIPGRFFPFGRVHKESGAIIPPSEVLGELCLRYFRECSDHGKMVRVLRSCILHWAGMSKEQFEKDTGNELVVGFMTLLFSPNPQATLQTVETQGTAPEISFKELERWQKAIAIASLAPVNPDKVQTLGENIINVSLSEATLAASAVIIRDGFEDLMKITAAQEGKGPDDVGKIHVPTEFVLTQDEEKTIELLKWMRENDEISWESLVAKISSLKPDLEIDPAAERLLLDAELKKRDKESIARTRGFAGGDPMGEDEE